MCVCVQLYHLLVCNFLICFLPASVFIYFMRLALLKLWEIKKCFIYEWLAASQVNRVRSDSEVWFLAAQTHMEIIVLYEL